MKRLFSDIQEEAEWDSDSYKKKRWALPRMPQLTVCIKFPG